MIVVLDTSCISTFIRIDKIDFLIKILGSNKIVITEQIFQELRLSNIEKIRNFKNSKIEIKNSKSDISKKYNLHIGEASVIEFAKENKALAIIDDKKARRSAEKEGIYYIGTATILKLALDKNLISKTKMKELLIQITTIGKLYLTEDIVSWILEG